MTNPLTEAVARVICCPDGCRMKFDVGYQRPCSARIAEPQATAALAVVAGWLRERANERVEIGPLGLVFETADYAILKSAANAMEGKEP